MPCGQNENQSTRPSYPRLLESSAPQTLDLLPFALIRSSIGCSRWDILSCRKISVSRLVLRFYIDLLGPLGIGARTDEDKLGTLTIEEADIFRHKSMTLHPRVSATAGRHTSNRRSTTVTIQSIAITNAARISMPANTPATSNMPSACWIR